MSTIQGQKAITIMADPPAAKAVAAPQKQESFWGEDGFTFGDLIDVINPLQHIPVVSHVYRAITGDTQSTGAKVVGGGLFGGVVGLLASFVDASTTGPDGKDMGERIMAALNPSETTPVPAPEPVEEPVMLAEVAPQENSIRIVPEPRGVPAYEHTAPSAVPEEAIQPTPETDPQPQPILAALPEELPGTPDDGARQAEVQAAIAKYLKAVENVEKDDIEDRFAQIAKELLL